MKHIPHLYLPGPWEGETLEAGNEQVDHLSRVLRLGAGSEVTYTDGDGTFGQGFWSGGAISRSGEEQRDRPSGLVVATAPPSSRDRVRFLVEKVAELGVERLLWLTTRHGVRRVPPLKKQRSWAISALEQSRGSWLMGVSDDFVVWDSLERPLAVCLPGGSGDEAAFRTVAVGPEGGFGDDEVPPDATAVDLGPTILRVETAAVVAASRFR
ncbi:MAG: 16S rRNA (uracil(1498)-N(3))-methyltransferase [Acidimicrobiia bacterium]